MAAVRPLLKGTACIASAGVAGGTYGYHLREREILFFLRFFFEARGPQGGPGGPSGKPGKGYPGLPMR